MSSHIYIFTYIMFYEIKLAISNQMYYILCLTGKQVVNTYNLMSLFYQIITQV